MTRPLMTRGLLALLAFLALVGARDPILVPEVSQHEVQVRQGFTGTELLLFGAILEPDGRRAGSDYDIVVVLKGPTEPIRLREKQKILGVWINADSSAFRSAASSFAVASSFFAWMSMAMDVTSSDTKIAPAVDRWSDACPQPGRNSDCTSARLGEMGGRLSESRVMGAVSTGAVGPMRALSATCARAPAADTPLNSSAIDRAMRITVPVRWRERVGIEPTQPDVVRSQRF